MEERARIQAHAARKHLRHLARNRHRVVNPLAEERAGLGGVSVRLARQRRRWVWRLAVEFVVVV